MGTGPNSRPCVHAEPAGMTQCSGRPRVARPPPTPAATHGRARPGPHRAGTGRREGARGREEGAQVGGAGAAGPQTGGAHPTLTFVLGHQPLERRPCHRPGNSCAARPPLPSAGLSRPPQGCFRVDVGGAGSPSGTRSARARWGGCHGKRRRRGGRHGLGAGFPGSRRPPGPRTVCGLTPRPAVQIPVGAGSSGRPRSRGRPGGYIIPLVPREGLIKDRGRRWRWRTERGGVDGGWRPGGLAGPARGPDRDTGRRWRTAASTLPPSLGGTRFAAGGLLAAPFYSRCVFFKEAMRTGIKLEAPAHPVKHAPWGRLGG